MLVEVMEHGSGRAARVHLPADIVVAGKSGTSSDYRDSWFAGFAENHLAVVWIGYDDNAPTGLTGSSGSLAVWSRLMASIGTTSWNAPLPEGVQEVTIEFPTGLVAQPECGVDVISIAVPRGVSLPTAPGCEVGILDGLGERAREWWRGIIR
jgi:penicillin-binding protein 1B